MVIALTCFAVTGVTIYRYLASTFRLLEGVKALSPEIWERLDRPEKVRYQRHGDGLGYHVSYTIQPLWPWLRWVWKGDPDGLDYRLAPNLRTTGRLLRHGLGLLLVTFAVFFYAIVIAPPG